MGKHCKGLISEREGGGGQPPSSLPWESLPIPWRRSEGCHYYYEKRKGRTKVPLWPLVVVDGGQSPTDPAFHLESPVYTTPRYNSLPPYGQAGDRPSDRRPTPYLFLQREKGKRAVAEFPFGPGKGRECPSVRRTMDSRYQSRREGGEGQPSNFQDPPFKKRGIDGRKGGEQTLHVS